MSENSKAFKISIALLFSTVSIFLMGAAFDNTGLEVLGVFALLPGIVLLVIGIYHQYWNKPSESPVSEELQPPPSVDDTADIDTTDHRDTNDGNLDEDSSDEVTLEEESTSSEQPAELPFTQKLEYEGQEINEVHPGQKANVILEAKDDWKFMKKVEDDSVYIQVLNKETNEPVITSDKILFKEEHYSGDLKKVTVQVEFKSNLAKDQVGIVPVEVEMEKE